MLTAQRADKGGSGGMDQIGNSMSAKTLERRFRVKKKSYAVLLLILLMSCTARYNIYYKIDDFNIGQIKQKNCIIFIGRSIEIREYIDSFNDEYNTAESFRSFVLNQLKLKLKSQIPNIEANSSTDIDDYFNKKEIDPEFMKLPNILNHDYIIYINNIVIDEKVTIKVKQKTEGRVSESRKSDCVVNFYVDIIDVKQQEKVMSFHIRDFERAFIDYRKALTEAVNNIMDSLVYFIEKDGLIEDRFLQNIKKIRKINLEVKRLEQQPHAAFYERGTISASS